MHRSVCRAENSSDCQIRRPLQGALKILLSLFQGFKSAPFGAQRELTNNLSASFNATDQRDGREEPCQLAFANCCLDPGFLSSIRKESRDSPVGHKGSPLDAKTIVLPSTSGVTAST